MLAYQLGDDQAHAHTALGLRLEHIFRDRRFVSVFDAALFQFFTGALHHAIEFSLHDRVWQVEFCVLDQSIQSCLFVAPEQAELHFALEVAADIGTQTCDGGISRTQRLGQLVSDFWQMAGFKLFQGHHEVGGFTSHFTALVVGGKSQGEGLALADLHAFDRSFKLLQHLAFAHRKLEVLSSATIERLAVNLAFEIHRHAVIGIGCRVK